MVLVKIRIYCESYNREKKIGIRDKELGKRKDKIKYITCQVETPDRTEDELKRKPFRIGRCETRGIKKIFLQPYYI